MDLSNKLTSSLDSDVEKYRAIFKWICDNIENDYSLFMRNKRKRAKYSEDPKKLHEWNARFNPIVFDQLVRNYRTICTGYSYLLVELAYLAGLESYRVDGYGRTAKANIGGKGVVNHSWAVVKLNGKWYLSDPTWASGKIMPEKGFVKQFKETYFLTSPELFAITHYPLEDKWLLLETEFSFDEFLNGPLIYQAGISQNILPVFPREFMVNESKSTSIQFKIRSSEADSLKMHIKRASSVQTINLIPKTVSPDTLYVEQTFPHKGTFDVHFTRKGEFLFTYQVTVN